MDKIEGTDKFVINVDEQLRPSIERQLFGYTNMDVKINSLPIPKKPIQIKISIILLRWYQRVISPKLGNRCVFEPSCSHYSELAIRKNGLLKGGWETIKRLNRCRPGAGGIDLPKTKGENNAI